MKMNNASRIIDRIRKLTALSQSENQHEAELAAEHASKLMQEHQITMREIDVEEQRASGVEEHFYNGETIARRWVPVLAGGAARLFDGRSVSIGTKSIYFVGFDEDMQAATQMFEHLYQAWFSIVKQDEKEAFAEHQAQGILFKRGPWRNSHGWGYAQAIRKRISTLVQERKAAVSSAGSTGTALVVMKDKALDEFYAKKKYGTKKGGNAGSSSDGYSAGARAGNSAALGGAIGGNSTILIG